MAGSPEKVTKSTAKKATNVRSGAELDRIPGIKVHNGTEIFISPLPDRQRAQDDPSTGTLPEATKPRI
ncbi:MAG: hypothetical protein UV59_C0044G0006 [Candidatus Gottesmanbacteria bacterium GW2011_GWA1_43_11]|uniref:Uncharacterized protein n=1 Tax=Candidatus Gottesmanbacteria bacterium GW2011_GWA1_43_11 TaxID=1618436 RepID=A0A0G1F8W1_9BACT|nr:MAG: hypothetical protein UV59_C0044G0006 [Candidatus Gottesmanbacteria bacterium GW2011_GWA1_43_11]